MLSKRRQEQLSCCSNEAIVSNPSNEDAKLKDNRRLTCNPTHSTNGLVDESVRAARHVHWQSDLDTESQQMSPPSTTTIVKQHFTDIEPRHSRGSAGGGRGKEVTGGVRLVSGHRVISVRPFAATPDNDDDDEEKMERKTGFVYASAKPKNFPGITQKNRNKFSQRNCPPLDIHSELPVIDLESDSCTASGARDRHFVSENPIEKIRASRLRSDSAKPKSFLSDYSRSSDVTAPVIAFDNPDNSPDLESSSSPLVTVSYLRHDPMAAAGDAARAPTLPENSGGPNSSSENAEESVVESIGGAGCLPIASDAAAAAAAAAADLEGPEPLLSASSSSSRSIDQSPPVADDFLADLSLLPDSVDPDDRTPFARIGPDEDPIEERGECDGEEAPGSGFPFPGSSLIYANEMVLTTRPTKVSLLYSPAPPRTRILFQITRDKIGFYRKYYAHLELNGEKIFYLAGRKRMKSRSSSYVISIDRERMLRACDAYVGKLRSNYVGTKFTLYNPAKASLSCSEDKTTRAKSKGSVKEELAAIIYAPNPLGFYGPRRMTVILPSIAGNNERIQVTSENADNSLLGRFKARQLKNLVIFNNKPPVWERAKNSYVLNFNGRVTQPSVKNFQLVTPDDHNDVVMQFGRIGRNAFTMDYKRPLSAVQAFGIALSCFDCKLACE